MFAIVYSGTKRNIKEAGKIRSLGDAVYFE